MEISWFQVFPSIMIDPIYRFVKTTALCFVVLNFIVAFSATCIANMFGVCQLSIKNNALDPVSLSVPIVMINSDLNIC